MGESIGNSLVNLIKRELWRLSSRRIYLFVMIVAPLACYLFVVDLLKDGLPANLPVAVVDMDNTTTSRALVRSLNSFGQTEVVMKTDNFEDARKAMQRSEIYGIFLIPQDFRRDASSGGEPTISFYTNDSYILAGSLVYKDMRMQAVLANGVVQRTLLLAHGESEPLLSARLMPIAVDTHPLNNPWLSYSIYLSNILLPAFLCMFVMFTTAFSIGEEVKEGSAAEWLKMGNNSIVLSLVGKLLPQALIFMVMGSFYLFILYGYLHFPLNSGLFPMFLAMMLLVLSCQAFAVFVTGIARRNRIALSACALWGVLAFSISGFTYPVRSMPIVMQIFSNFFQMRQYFLIYVDQALNGIPMMYSWKPYAILFAFLFLPIIVLPKLKEDLLRNKYLP